MQLRLLFAFLFAAFFCNAQKSSFDIYNFTPPEGWKQSVTEDNSIMTFTKVDKTNKTWVVINLTKATPSKGSIAADFNSEWETLVVKNYNATSKSENEVQEADGWKIKAAGGKFSFNNTDAMLLMTTFSGYDVCASIVMTTNSASYLDAVQEFIGSVELNKELVKKTAPVTKTTETTNITAPSGQFTYSTTNFDDGWTSVIKEDWVEVTKGDIKVYLLYAVPYNASDFTGTGLVDRDYYWDNYVSKYFTIQTKQYKENGEVISSLKPPYVEGWATDKQTGLKRFIGMRLDITPGAASIVIASAKDEASLWHQFPNANGGAWSLSDLSNMNAYNKFAIGEKDLLGTWEDGSSSAMQWYYTAASGNPGGYAGMTIAATSASFNFLENGNYNSVHNGATGVVGAINTFHQNYKGKYTVTNWSITATNRWNDKTENFSSWFRIIRGGRILCMDSESMQYRLVKTK